ncbi:MAG: NAD(P)H-dependent oxidoreductase subunit E, partial [Sedimentisphaerales bacterium]|nr:NAD(P)H-dependent oxidoreductase subunit E [Sedimentisphaerales bacterium]
MTTDIDTSYVEQAVARIGHEARALIPLLQAIQSHYGYLPEPALRRLTELTEITPAAIAGVSTFYSQFRHSPVGKHMVSVCTGTACHVKGGEQIFEGIRRHLGLQGREDTDSQKVFTVQKVACLGCCTLAPAVQIGEVTYGHLTLEKIPRMLDDYLEIVKRGGLKKSKHLQTTDKNRLGEIRLGLGSCCVARGSGKLYEAFEQALLETRANVTVKQVGCVGMCHQTPLAEVVLPDNRSYLYAQVAPEDAKAILLRHFKPQGLSRRIATSVSRTMDRLLTDAAWQPVGRLAIDTREKPVAAFLDQQKHIATEYCGFLDPLDLDEYTAGGGFEALKRCLHDFTPDDIIKQIKTSQLRGRGGAGYPTGFKWETVRREQDPEKHIVCNGDEGDPGAFMDRMLLESYPYRIIEGMIIAAWTVGARQGTFYIRAEYPLA